MVNSLTLTIDLPKHILDRTSSFQAEAGASIFDDRQVQLNSLALYAANWYLQCLQFNPRYDDSPKEQLSRRKRRLIDERNSVWVR
jgi:hypothetical protein